jgi:hypothetical protein
VSFSLVFQSFSEGKPLPSVALAKEGPTGEIPIFPRGPNHGLPLPHESFRVVSLPEYFYPKHIFSRQFVTVG